MSIPVEFRTRKEGFAQIRKRLLIMMLFTVLLMASVVARMLQGQPEAGSTVAIMVPLLVGVLGYSTYNSLKKQRAIYDSTVIRIDDEKIVRENSGMPTITIPRREITSVTRNNNGSITIVGNSKLNAIGIPAMMENQETLDALIDALGARPATTSEATAQRMIILAMLVGAGIFLVAWFSSNPTLRLISSILIIALFAWFFYVIQRSKNIDRRTRAISWIAIVPLLAAVFNVWRYFSG